MPAEAPSGGAPAPDREPILDSWKEIASYLGRAVRTVQTWEKEEELPVHRHLHAKGGTVYAYPSEIEAWRRQRDERNGAPARAFSGWRRWWPAAALVMTAVIAAGVVGQRRGREAGSAPVVAEPGRALDPGWLVLAEIDNRTGEAILSGTLEAGLRRELANSRFVKLAPPERIGDALRLMGRREESVIDAELAREVALRDGGIGAILTARVEKDGSSYLLSAELLRAADGVGLASLRERANGQEALLAAVDRLAVRVREDLGETAADIRASQQVLSQVSTPSLRALELYSRADRLLRESDLSGPYRDRTAEELLREAIAEDPLFASSYIHLAWSLFRQGRPAEDYLPLASRAVELAERATAVERYFIRASLLELRASSTGRKSDLEAAVGQYLALLQLAPGHYWAGRNAVAVLRRLGRGLETVGLALRQVEARPNDVATLVRAAREIVLNTGDLPRARALVERAEALRAVAGGPEEVVDPFLELFPVHEAWSLGEVDEAVARLDRLAAGLDTRPASARSGLARGVMRYYLDLGMVEEARRIYVRFSVPPRAFWDLLLRWRDGDGEYVREALLGRLAPDDLPQTAYVASILAQFGYFEDASRLLARLSPEFELEPGLVARALGTIAVGEGRYREAVPLLEEALSILRYQGHLGDYFYGAQTLAEAWEALGEAERGLAVLEEASRGKASALRQGYHWMALRLRLADSYRAMGREAEARAVEDDLRRHCAHADHDFSIVQELQPR